MIGARRCHQAMLSQGLNSRLVVVDKRTNDPTVIQAPRAPLRRKLAKRVAKNLLRLQNSDFATFRTVNLINTGMADFLNGLGADIFQLHWIGNNTLSIGELPRLKAPVFWKLPDLWAMAGTEHYPDLRGAERVREGYAKTNRPMGHRGLDVDRFIWTLKKQAWATTQLHIIGPSRWITKQAEQSALLAGLPRRHILNPLDLQLYRPLETQQTGRGFDLPQEKKIGIFGAMGSTSDPRKGFHHLVGALDHLPAQLSPGQIAFAVFGSGAPRLETINGYQLYHLGNFDQEADLVAAYNAADFLIFPSEMDNLPNVVKEATCCGVPCVGFKIGGMPDMVHHLETGYLAHPFDTRELAAGIGWIAARSDDPGFRKTVRDRAAEKHDPAIVVPQYLDFYRTAFV